MAAKKSKGGKPARKPEKPKCRHKTTPPALSLQEIRFCQGYVEHGDASRAYREAGFPDRPPESTWVLAFKRLRKVKVREYVQDLRDAACEAAKATVEELARGFRRAERADVTTIFGDNGEVLPPSRWPAELRAAVTSVKAKSIFDTTETGGKRKKVKVGTEWEVKVENKTEARKVLAQWRGMIGNKAGGEDDADGARPDTSLLGRIAALIVAEQSRAGGAGRGADGVPGVDPVDAEAGTGGGLPEPG